MKLGDDDEDEETREAIGDSSSTATKWHAHTVQVLTMLQRNIGNGSATGDDDDESAPQQSGKPTTLHFNAISKNCSRRTAAGVFFELLQLKTWDFVELDQDEPYGDMSISAGTRFHESPPNGKKSGRKKSTA
jgi:cohesin complex subunit SCC1